LRRKEWYFDPRSIGDHIRQRRLQLGLSQKALAAVLKVTQFSIINWERGVTQPTRPGVLRRVVDFLGTIRSRLSPLLYRIGYALNADGWDGASENSQRRSG
jgi:transcriptional regulator with XRE-family HTH domain